MPRISVVIATYNRAAYIGTAISSALNQTYRDIEVIVIDDGSTDGTADVVATFPTVRYEWQENAERGAARNRGFRISSGEYVTFLDSDDLLLPEAIELELEAMLHRPRLVLVYGDILYVDASGRFLGTLRRNSWEGDVLDKIAVRNFVGLSANLVRRDAFEKAGAFNEERELAGSEDWEAWVRLAAVGPFGHVKRPVLRYRVHAQSTVGNPSSMQRSMLRAWELIYSNPALRPALAHQRAAAKACVHITLCHLWRASGGSREARSHLRLAVEAAPSAVFRGSFLGAAVRLMIGRRLVASLSILKRWAERRLTGGGTAG